MAQTFIIPVDCNVHKQILRFALFLSPLLIRESVSPLVRRQDHASCGAADAGWMRTAHRGHLNCWALALTPRVLAVSLSAALSSGV